MTHDPLPPVRLSVVLEAGCRTIEQAIDDYLTGRGGPAAAAQRLTEAVAALREHIYVQEELLFPLLREAGMQGPVHAMSVDHHQLWGTLDRLEADLATPASPDVRTAARMLQAELDRHTSTERPVVIAHVEDVLTEQQQGRLLHQLSRAHTPPGWTCTDPSDPDEPDEP